MNNRIKRKVIIILTIICIIRLFLLCIHIIRGSISTQSLYDTLPENIIVVGEEVFEGDVNPNFIASASVEYYKKTNNKNIYVYKYSGIDENNNPIWGKYSDEANSYIAIDESEINTVEEILTKKYKISS